jgi:DNA-binding LytR/AlgR family response regulator
MNKTNFTALIIDDEPPARAIVRSFLQQHPQISVVGECGNGFEALKSIRENNPDILFLDVQMIYAENSRHLRAQIMRYFEEHLEPSQLVTIHRYMVNISFMKRLEPFNKDTYVASMTEGQRLKISHTGYKKLKETLNF